MLARANRVNAPGDFRTTVRNGRRAVSRFAIVYASERDGRFPTRFGFIVGKAVGSAVRRNLVRRRLRSIAHEVLGSLPTGRDIVVRALPGSQDARWDDLRREVAMAIDRSVGQS